MKVEYRFNGFGWCWAIDGEASGDREYTRRRDAVRGFERFCARVRAM